MDLGSKRAETISIFPIRTTTCITDARRLRSSVVFLANESVQLANLDPPSLTKSPDRGDVCKAPCSR
jgi:hypothetical protein